MLLKLLILLFVGLCSGLGVAAGTFAFFVVIRVLPRMIQKAKLEHKVIFIENILIRGILFGTVLSFFLWRKKWLYVIFGKTLLTFYGLSAAFGGRVPICNGAGKNGRKSVLFFLRVWYTWTIGRACVYKWKYMREKGQRIREIKEVGLRYGSINRKTEYYYKVQSADFRTAWKL